MDHHCRLCGDTKNTLTDSRRPVEKSDLKLHIQRAFSIDISEDDPLIHPPYVCHLCKTKLSRWWKNHSKKKTRTTGITLHTFEPHVTNCQDNMAGGVSSTSYSKNLLLELQRQRSKELYCDFVFKVQDEIFKVHKCILAAHSVLPKKVLDEYPDNTWSIGLADKSARAVLRVLNFMYTGYLDFTDVPVEEIWEAAIALEIPEAEKMCKMYLQSVNTSSRTKVQQGGYTQFAGKGIKNPSRQKHNTDSVVRMVCVGPTGSQAYVISRNELTNDNNEHSSLENKTQLTAMHKTATAGKDVNLAHHWHGSAKSDFHTVGSTNMLNQTVNDVTEEYQVEHHPKQLHLLESEIGTAASEFEDPIEKIKHEHDEAEALENEPESVLFEPAVSVKLEADFEPIMWEVCEKQGDLILKNVGERNRDPLLSSMQAVDTDDICEPVKSETVYQTAETSKRNDNETSLFDHSCSQNVCFDFGLHENSAQVNSVPSSDMLCPSLGKSAAAMEDLSKKVKNLVCAICKSILRTQRSLFHHIQKLHKKFPVPKKCLYCPRRFLHIKNMISHTSSFHPKVNVQSCVVKQMNDLDLAAVSENKDKLSVKCALNACGSYKKLCYKSRKTLYQQARNKPQQLKFKCLICRRAFPSQWSLRSHRQCVHQDKVTCEVCDEKFNSVLQARKHIAETHREKPIPAFSCKFCYRDFPLIALLENHTCSDKSNLICKICVRQCHTYGHYMRHQKDDKKRAFSCDICGKSYGKQCTLKRHKDSHYQESMYLCPICKKTVLKVEKTAHLNEHKVAATDSEGKITYQLECPRCKKHFKHILQCATHIRTHQNECDICGRKFRHPETLRKHKAARHTASEIICDECGMGFKTASALKHHKNHKMCLQSRACPFCGEVFQKWGIFIRHVRKHKLRAVHPRVGHGEYYSCPLCSRLFTQFHYLQVHMSVHRNGKPHKCTHCKRGFMRENSLKSHLAAVHGEPVAKTHICTICNKILTTPFNLRKHMNKHTGDRDHCKICHLGIYSHNMRQHMQTFHECEECGETFEKKLDKVAHEETGHPDLHGSYVCDVCGKLFSFPGAFQRHKQNHKIKNQNKTNTRK